MNLQDYSRFISKQNRGKNPPEYDDGVSRCFPSSFLQNDVCIYVRIDTSLQRFLTECIVNRKNMMSVWS